MRRRCLNPRSLTAPRLYLVSSAAEDAERAAEAFAASMPQHDPTSLNIARAAYVIGWLECAEHLARGKQ